MLQLQPSQPGKPNAVSWTIARISRGASEGITNHQHFQIIKIFQIISRGTSEGITNHQHFQGHDQNGATQEQFNTHKPFQACRVLSLENGTVVKQGVSPRGLCQGILLIIDH